MAADMHTIHFMLEYAKTLFIDKNYNGALGQLEAMEAFIYTAELSPPAMMNVEYFMKEGDELRSNILAKLPPVPKKSWLSRVWPWLLSLCNKH